jgi:hypothetical protein
MEQIRKDAEAQRRRRRGDKPAQPRPKPRAAAIEGARKAKRAAWEIAEDNARGANRERRHTSDGDAPVTRRPRRRRAESEPAREAAAGPGHAAMGSDHAAVDANRARAAMLKRLGILRELVWRQFRRAPLKAIDRALRIEEREAALLGLDFPRRHQVVNYDAEKIPIAALREHLWRAQPQPPPAPVLAAEAERDEASARPADGGAPPRE